LVLARVPAGDSHLERPYIAPSVALLESPGERKRPGRRGEGHLGDQKAADAQAQGARYRRTIHLRCIGCLGLELEWR
jgi:hypothetical protein